MSCARPVAARPGGGTWTNGMFVQRTLTQEKILNQIGGQYCEFIKI